MAIGAIGAAGAIGTGTKIKVSKAIGWNRANGSAGDDTKNSPDTTNRISLAEQHPRVRGITNKNKTQDDEHHLQGFSSLPQGHFSAENPKEAATEACKFWFLLDYDIVEAFKKGNYRLAPMAWARINYLTKVIDPKLLQEGLKGEEESLWEIHRKLLNEGWWDRAQNLKVRGVDSEHQDSQDNALRSFLLANESLIHTNT
ncbi:hypothetical protein ACET3Z_025890 [Daucus carota]